MIPNRVQTLLLCALVTSILSRPSKAASDISCPAPTAGSHIHLPADDSGHFSAAQNSEWWYYNGHLRTASGLQYGFELVFFQLKKFGSEGRVAQFAITDINHKQFYHHTWIIPGTYRRISNGFNLSVPDGPRAQRANGIDHLQATLPNGIAIDLRLRSQKPAIPEFGDGLIQYLDPVTKFKLGYDYYYSRTRIAVTGSITVGNKSKAVYGLSWFDHEWGDLYPASWDWYSIQLDNGEDVMAYTVRKYASSQIIAAGVTAVNSDGCKFSSYRANQFIMTHSGSWISPHTGANYPTNFRLQIPSRHLDLHLTPVLQDQEVTSPVISYWEGAINVTGTEGKIPVHGLGYTELAGYQKL